MRASDGSLGSTPWGWWLWGMNYPGQWFIFKLFSPFEAKITNISRCIRPKTELLNFSSQEHNEI